MATPDAIARLPASGLKGEAREMWQTYFREQQHSSLAAFMRHVLSPEEKRENGLFIQVRIMQKVLVDLQMPFGLVLILYCPALA